MADYTKIFGQFSIESDFLYCMVLDKSGTIIYANNALSNLLTGSISLLANTPFYDFLPDENHEAFRTTISNTVLKGSLTNCSWKLLTNVGKAITAKANCRVFEMEGYERIACILQDITTQKEIEEALQEHNKILENLNNQSNIFIETAQLGTWTLDLKTGENVWNDKLVEMYGLTRAQFDEDTTIWQRLIHPEDKEQIELEISRIAQGETISTVFRVITPSGEIRHMRASGAPLYGTDGTVAKITGANIDITQQVLQRQILIDQQHQFETFTDHLPGMVFRYFLYPDGSDHISYLSKGVEDIYEIERDLVQNDVSLLWDCIFEDDIAGMKESIMKSAESLRNWEYIHRVRGAKSGVTKYLKSRGTPQKLTDGTTVWDTLQMDVTHQVEQELRLWEQREMLDKLTNQVPGIVYIYRVYPDESEKMIYLSKGFEEIWEVTVDKALNNIALIWDAIFDEDLPKVQEAIRESAELLTEYNSTFRIKTASGAIKFIKGTGIPYRLDDGSIEWYSIGIDLTEQLKQQEKMEAAKNQLESIANQVPGIVVRYCIHPDGTDEFLFVNDKIEPLFGVKKEQAMKNSGLIRSRYHEEDAQSLRAVIEHSRETLTPWEHIYRYYDNEGEIRYLQGFGSPKKMPNGDIIWDAISVDVTHRILAEREASISNQKLRRLINSSPIAVYQINPEGVVTDFWNAAAEHIYGWTREQVIGKPIPTLNQENQHEFLEVIEDIRNTGKPKQLKVERTNRFGEQLQLNLTIGPLFDENGKLTDLLILANNVTELEDSRKTIEKALHEKEILLQEIHHRVKNNLAIISGLLELQAMKDDNESDLSVIFEARNRIHSIAMVHEQLYRDMDFSHINPDDYYRKLLKKLQANTIRADREIEYDLYFEIPRININRAVPLGLLINELFTNSIKYAFKEKGGKLKLHFRRDGDKVKVIYSDNGPGFVVDEIRNKGTIGWQLIETLLAQLDAEFIFDTNNRFYLEFSFMESVRGSQSNIT